MDGGQDTLSGKSMPFAGTLLRNHLSATIEKLTLSEGRNLHQISSCFFFFYLETDSTEAICEE